MIGVTQLAQTATPYNDPAKRTCDISQHNAYEFANKREYRSRVLPKQWAESAINLGSGRYDRYSPTVAQVEGPAMDPDNVLTHSYLARKVRIVSRLVAGSVARSSRGWPFLSSRPIWA